MRVVAVVVVALVVAALAGFWLLRVEEPTAPPGSRPEVPSTPDEPAAPAFSERRAAAAEAPVAPAANDSPLPEAPAAPGGAAPGDVPVTVVLQVRALATRAPLPAFRWRFVQPAGTVRGDAQGGRAELPLPGGAVGELLVEADGMQPSTMALQVPSPPAAARFVDVFLEAAPAATGITLRVTDVAQQPVGSVRVDAFVLELDNRDAAWHLGRPLWQRRAAAPDGRYQLPALPPGEYGILLTAVDEGGAPVPLLPYRHRFALTGSNGFVEDVPLEPGCLFRLELVEVGGTALDPARRGVVGLDLRPTGGEPIPRKWVVDAHGAALASAIDVLPGVGPVYAAEPVAPGSYTLTVTIDGTVRASVPLLLQPGAGQPERVVVP